MKKIISVCFFLSVLCVQPSIASEAVKGVKKDFAHLMTELTAQLVIVEGKIKELKEKGKQKGSAIHEKTVKELEGTQEKLRSEVAELKDEGEVNWQKFKDGFAKSVDALNSKVQKALKD